MLRAISSRITPVGGAGTATATATFGVNPSELRMVAVLYPSAPATTTIVVSNLGRNVLAPAATNTPGLYRPREVAQTNVGVDIAGTTVFPVLNGLVSVVVANANAAVEGVIVTLYVEEGG